MTRLYVLAAILIGLVSASILVSAQDHNPAPPNSGPTESPPLQGTGPDFQMQIQPNQFLMVAGRGATPGLVFTPLYGFVGNVALSSSVSPAKASAPTITQLPSSVRLNASIPGSPLYSIALNSTATTPFGLYTITITGISGSITHTATGTVGVTSTFVPSNGAELVYYGNFTTAAYPGGSTTLSNTFEDLGYVPIGPWNLTVTTSFGTFHPTLLGGFSSILIVNTYEEKTTALVIQVPGNTKPGNYQVTITVKWLLDPLTIYQQPGPDLVTQGNLTVYASPRPTIPNLFTPILLAGLGVAAAVAIITVGLVLWNESKRRKSIAAPTSNLESSWIAGQVQTCPNCGTITIGGRFCPKCGNQISQA